MLEVGSRRSFVAIVSNNNSDGYRIGRRRRASRLMQLQSGLHRAAKKAGLGLSSDEESDEAKREMRLEAFGQSGSLESVLIPEILARDCCQYFAAMVLISASAESIIFVPLPRPLSHFLFSKRRPHQGCVSLLTNRHWISSVVNSCK